MRQSIRLALWSVLRHRRRSGFAIGAVGFGVIALILAGGFIEWIFWAAREGAIQTGLGHIQVAKQGFQDKGSADLQRFLLPADSPLLDELRRSPAVKTVAPRRTFSGLASRADTTISFLAEAFDPESERKAGNVSSIVKGEDLSVDASDGVILGYGLAANLGVTLGETIVLLVNKPGGGVNAVEARVRGLFATISKAYDDSAMRVPFALATRLLGEDGAHRWIVYLDDTAQTPASLAAFRERFAASGLEFVPWYELADFYHKTVRLLSRQMAVVHLIIALIIVLTISNAMMMAVRERTSEIGTSMALGTRRRAVLVQFLFEGGLIGIVGGALGVAIGIGLAGLISAIGIPMPPPPGQSQAYRAEMIVTAPASVVAFVLAVMTALGAALYPAWSASRLRIVDALRHNR